MREWKRERIAEKERQRKEEEGYKIHTHEQADQ